MLALSPPMQPRQLARAQGFTLVELLIGMVLSLIVVLAVTTVFINGTAARRNLDRVTTLTESGRYLTEQLVVDVQSAGFFAQLDMRQAVVSKDVTADLPNFCDLSIANLDLSWPFFIQGVDAQGQAPPACVADWKAGTDVLVIRRLSSCQSGDPGCVPPAGVPLFQIANCNNANELGSPDADDWYALGTNAAALDKTERDCATPARNRRYRQHVYYIAQNDLAGDGIPTLKRLVIGPGGYEEEPIANGVEEMQIEYGIDTNNDGGPDAFSSNPSLFAGCADADCRRANWRNVTTVRIHVLVRSDTELKSPPEPMVYEMGRSLNGAMQRVGPFSDKYERQLFSTTIALRNVVGLRR